MFSRLSVGIWGKISQPGGRRASIYAFQEVMSMELMMFEG
jgi:hypothetical protein